MGAMVNGQPVFAGIASPGGQVVAESRVVESKEPFLTVTFTIGDRGQTAVSGLTVERVDAAAAPAATVRLPPRADPEAMAKNLAAKLAADNATIDSVLTDLAAHGIPATAFGVAPNPAGTTKILATIHSGHAGTGRTDRRPRRDHKRLRRGNAGGNDGSGSGVDNRKSRS